MTTPTGVEENENSRFIDYTIVGDFEELENVIEVALKGWMKKEHGEAQAAGETKEIAYQQSKLVLSICNTNEYSDPRPAMPVWFGLDHGTRYVVLSKSRTWTSHTKSERKYLFGALVSALNSCGYHNLPVFSTASDLDTIESSPEIDGYCVSEGSSGRENPLVTHYESNQLSSIDTRHALFYADGVRQMFNHVVSGRRPKGENSALTNSVSLRLLETFEYNSRVLKSGKFEERAYRGGYSAEQSSHPDDDAQDRILCATFFRRSILSRAPLGEETSCLRGLSKITLTLCFDRTNGNDSNAVSDNRSFSNLVPSLLPFDCWTVQVAFDNSHGDQMDGGVPNFDGNDYGKRVLSQSRLSAVIRRLLGLYIFGKTAPVGLCMQDLRREREAGGRVEGTQKAQSIGLILSPAVRADLRELCGFVRMPLDDREASGLEARHQAQRDWYLKVLFPCYDTASDEPTEQTDPNGRFFYRASYKGDEEESIPFGGWLSMCSLCVGSLYGDLGDIAHFWKMCTEGFRSCYDEGIEIADIDLSYQSVNSAKTEVVRGPQATSEQAPLEHHKKMWEHLLWSDVLRRKNTQSGAGNDSSARLCMGCLNRVEMPDTQQILSVQKLRMMIFCAAVKDEEPVTNGLDVPLARRLPLTSDHISHQRAILTRLDEEGDKSEEGLVLRWQVANAATVSDIRSFKAAKPGTTLDDFLDWYRLTSDEEFTNLASILHPGTMPSLESAKLAQNTRKELFLLWQQLEACPAKEQKPIFRAETELEKSISFFESLTPVHFAAEMLCAALETSINIVVCEMCDILAVDNTELAEPGCQNCSCRRERMCHKAISTILLRDVRTLRQDVSLTVAAIREDVSPIDQPRPLSRDGDASESISQSLLLTLDALCEGFDLLEDFQEKVRALQSVFKMTTQATEGSNTKDKSTREMLVALAFETSESYTDRDTYCESRTEVPSCQDQGAGYTCRNSEEAEVLWQLGRYMHSEVSKDHAWHSDDARELGHPTAKTIFLSTHLAVHGQTGRSSDRLRVDLNRRTHSARLSFAHTEG